MYSHFTMQLVGLKLIQQEMKDEGHEIANDTFYQNVVEVDGMIVLIEAEIKRRNNLIGVIG